MNKINIIIINSIIFKLNIELIKPNNGISPSSKGELIEKVVSSGEGILAESVFSDLVFLILKLNSKFLLKFLAPSIPNLAAHQNVALAPKPNLCAGGSSSPSFSSSLSQ